MNQILVLNWVRWPAKVCKKTRSFSLVWWQYMIGTSNEASLVLIGPNGTLYTKYHLNTCLELMKWSRLLGNLLAKPWDWLLEEWISWPSKREEEQERNKKERKKEEENLPYFTMYSYKNPIKPMLHQDSFVLSLKGIKEEEKRKKKQGKQARILNW